MSGVVGSMRRTGLDMTAGPPFAGHIGSAVLAAGLRTIECRGPDEQGTWSGGGVSLAHARLAVSDPSHGQQPCTWVTPRGTKALVFSGKLYNHIELRQELRGLGHRLRSQSDTEVVFAALRTWGPAAVRRFVGMFALGYWDGIARTMLLVRDPLGIKPLYYRLDRDSLWFGSEPKTVLALAEAQPVIDLEGLRELLTSSWDMMQGSRGTGFRDVHEIPSGCTLLVTPHSQALNRYWQLTPRDHKESREATIQTAREMLERSVKQQTQADVPVCLLSSGGLDSSYLVAETARNQTERVNTFSVELAGSHAAAHDPMGRTADKQFIDAVSRRVRSRHRTVICSPEQLASPELRAQVVQARDGLSLGDFDASMLLLFQQVSHTHAVALLGDGADEVFGGYPWSGQDTAPQHLPWAGIAARVPWETVLAADLVPRLDLRGYREQLRSDSVRQLWLLAERPAHPDRAHRGRLESNYMELTHFLPSLLRRADRLSMSCGVEARVPFCDHQLVDYMFSVPWAVKRFDLREKSILRTVASGLVPASVLGRQKSPYPMTRAGGYRAAVERAAELALQENATLGAVFDVARLRAALTQPARPRLPREVWELVLDVHVLLTTLRPQLVF